MHSSTTQRSFPPSPVPRIRALHDTRPCFHALLHVRHNPATYCQVRKARELGRICPPLVSYLRSSPFVVVLHSLHVVDLAIVVFIRR